jgi:type IV fimbrial biogenesis protein FimT
MKMMQRYSQFGFTLIELMAALALAAILIALAVPSFTGLIERNRMESEVNRWLTDINFARSEAIKLGKQVSICRRDASAICDGDLSTTCQCGNSTVPNKEYHHGWLVFVDNSDSGHFQGPSGDVLLRVGGAASTGVTISGNQQANRRFSFTPNGELKSNDWPANTVLCTDNQSTNRSKGVRVAINTAGRAIPVELAVGASCDGYSYNGAQPEN